MQPENPGNLDSKDRGGNAPLHLAATAGHVEAVKALINLGSSVHQRNQEGETPLHRAAEAGHKAVVKMLLDAGADPSVQDNNGATPCHLAAGGGHIEIMELMSKRSDNKKTVKQLHEAAKDGSIKDLEQLLESPLNLNEKNERGETALYVAVSNGHRKFAEVLLEAGADPNIVTDGGSTVLHAAAMSGLATLINKLSISTSSNGKSSPKKEEKKAEPTPKKVSQKVCQIPKPKVQWQDIYKKCENLELTDSEDEGEKGKECEFQLPVIEEYLAALFNPDVSEQELNVMRQFLQELLMNLGKRMDVSTNLGRGATLLHLAAVCRAECTVRVLLQRGAKVRARNLDGVTPLIMGSAGGSLEVVRALVEAGADPRDADDGRRTPLHYAVRLGSLAMTKYLLSLGLDTNHPDKNGNTPLHIASLFGASPEVIMALCGAGGDVMARNKDRLYPFSLARDVLSFRLLHPPGVNFGDLLSPFII